MKYALLVAAAGVLAGCASAPTPTTDPMQRDAAPYVEVPDYDHAMVCDTRYDDLQKCEAAIKQLCGPRGFLDLRIRPLRQPGTDTASSTSRLLQLQCKPRSTP